MRRIITILTALMLSLPLMADRADLSWVESWGYQLQNINLNILEQSPYDALVIDYSQDGSDGSAFSSDEIASLQAQGKVVLAYLSIGEAEDYRFYWKKNWREGKPNFIGKENPNWDGNYKVKYWQSGWWKRVVRPYLNRIIKAGFDGVYLDIIDGYYYYGTKDNRLKKRANQMVKLVNKIAKYSRKRAGDNFIITPQNGLSILDDSSKKKRNQYIKTIDSIGIESLYFNIHDEDDKNYRIEKLSELTDAGKLILNVEYINESQHSEYADTWESSDLNIVGYPAKEDTKLDELVIVE